MLGINEIKALLSVRKRIVISTHNHPDGDAIGSSLGLYHFLHEQGHQVNIVTPSDYSADLHFLPHDDKIVIHSNNPEEAESLIATADILFALDYNCSSRIAQVSDFFTAASGTKILIDHHLYPKDFCDYSLSDTAASSTAELIYHFISLLGFEDSLSTNSANALYTGICTDTGRLKFGVRANTYLTVAKLVERGADVVAINRQIFDNLTENRLNFLGFFLSKRVTYLPQCNAAIMYISHKDVNHFQLKRGDTEGLVNYPLSVRSIQVAVLVKEYENEVKLSFRSKGTYEVNEFASQYFNGGGHKNAAGGLSNLSLSDTVKQLEQVLPDYYKDLCLK